MKSVTLALSLVLSTSAFANSEAILKQVDSLLANDTYAAAFACGDKSVQKTSFGEWEGENPTTNEVTKCGAETEIVSTDGEDVWSMAFGAADYNAIKGNPLRLLGAMNKTRLTDDFEWISAEAETVNYLGKNRKALKVTGKGEVCVEDEDGKEDCQMGSVIVRVVQGVPMLARLPILSIFIPQFNAWINQSVTSFIRK